MPLGSGCCHRISKLVAAYSASNAAAERRPDSRCFLVTARGHRACSHGSPEWCISTKRARNTVVEAPRAVRFRGRGVRHRGHRIVGADGRAHGSLKSPPAGSRSSRAEIEATVGERLQLRGPVRGRRARPRNQETENQKGGPARRGACDHRLHGNNRRNVSRSSAPNTAATDHNDMTGMLIVRTVSSAQP